MNRRRKIRFIRIVLRYIASPIVRLALLVLGMLLVTFWIVISGHGTLAQSADTSNPGGTDTTTQAYAGFQGKIGRTLAESIPSWPEPAATSLSPPDIVATAAPSGVPNIVVFLIDDMGYSDLGPYGSEISTSRIVPCQRLRFV